VETRGIQSRGGTNITEKKQILWGRKPCVMAWTAQGKDNKRSNWPKKLGTSILKGTLDWPTILGEERKIEKKKEIPAR